MPNEEQLSILRQGVDAWNGWRGKNKKKTVDLSEADLQKADLDGFDLSHAVLDGANLSGASLKKTNLASARLRRANLTHANLSHANLAHASLDRANLAFAHIEDAVLLFATLRRADLRGASLKRSSMEDVNLRHANLAHTHMEQVMLAFSDCANADLVESDLSGVNFTAVNLEKANVSGVKFDRNILWSLFKGTRMNPAEMWRRRYDFLLNTTIRCKGVHAACYGSQRFTNFLKGQDFLEELMETRKGRLICTAWWVLADCGRSFIRWGVWSCLIIFLFGLTYFHLGTPGFQLSTLPFKLGSMLYFSVVTFSTLGFGDIIPRTPVALFLTGLEVFLGYFMMGGLISIFATKIARGIR